MQRFFLTIGIAGIALAGCQQQAEQPAQPEASNSVSAPEAKPGLSVSGGRLVLPAVTGNPGAAYFSLNNGTGGVVTAMAVSIDGAGSAQMHQTAGGSMMPVDSVEMLPHSETKFEPGQLHVMAFKLDPALKPGGKAEMTVTFAGGDKVSTPLAIEGPGGTAAAMPMEHDH